MCLFVSMLKELPPAIQSFTSEVRRHSLQLVQFFFRAFKQWKESAILKKSKNEHLFSHL